MKFTSTKKTKTSYRINTYHKIRDDTSVASLIVDISPQSNLQHLKAIEIPPQRIKQSPNLFSLHKPKNQKKNHQPSTAQSQCGSKQKKFLKVKRSKEV